MSEEDMVYLEGCQAGEFDPGKNNPYVGTSLAKCWEEGWEDGRREFERTDMPVEMGWFLPVTLACIFVGAVYLIGAIYGYWTA